MADFFASGLAADLILAILILELVVLAWSRRMPLADIAGVILPGLLIILGLRAALLGQPWPWIATPLALAFPVHLLDLARRLRMRRRAP